MYIKKSVKKEDEIEEDTGSSLVAEAKLLYTESSFNRKPIKDGGKNVRFTCKNEKLASFKLQNERNIKPINTKIKVLQTNRTEKNVGTTTLCKLLPKTLHTRLPLNNQHVLRPTILESKLLNLHKTKSGYSEKKLLVLPPKISKNPSLVVPQNLQPLKSKTIVLHQNKAETYIDNKLCVTYPNIIDAKPSSLASKNIQQTISETVVIHLNKADAKSQIFCDLLPESIQSELLSDAKRNNVDFCITQVKSEQFSTSSGSLEDFELFLHAIFNIAYNAYPRVVQQRNRMDAQEITITFNCELKNSEKVPTVNKTPEEQSNSNKQRNFPLHTNTESLVSLEELETDFLKYNFNLSNNRINCNLSVDSFLHSISSVLSIMSNITRSSTIKVPTLHFGNWHFRNIAQGYLLKFLLRKNNVNTLNVMRNLYFIIITTNTTNLFLAVNFTLRNDVFVLEDIKPVSDFCDGTTITENESVCSFGTDSTFINENSSFGPDIYKIRQNVLTDSEGEDYMSFESNLSTTRTSCCTIVTGRRCIATSTIFPFNYLLLVKQTKDQAAGGELTSVVSEKIKHKSNCWSFKPWFLRQWPVTANCNVKNSSFNCNYFDETLFERMSLVERYLHIVTCECTSPEFYKVFLKCLSHTVGCTLISFLISLL